MRLVYDDLVRDYLDSLHSKLRNFAVEPEFLATWVHDEDDATSLYELFAAAREAGCRDLSLVIGAKTVSRIDKAALEKRLAPLGAIRIQSQKDGGWDIEAKLSDKPVHAAVAVAAPKAVKRAAKAVAAPAAKKHEGIHPAYKKGIAALSAAPKHEGASAAPAGVLLVEAADGAAKLFVAVAADGMVKEARHSGAKAELRGLLDGVCDLLPGRTFQEGADHALIRLEAKLRDHSVPAPVVGLLTPRNADPVFAQPLAMLRAAYKQWLAKSGAKPGWNFWDDTPAAAWSALSQEEKLRRSKDAVAAACKELSISTQGVEVLEVLGGCRIVLAANPETIKPTFAPQMLHLESRVKAKLDPRMEVQLESLEDRNRRAVRTQRTDKLI